MVVQRSPTVCQVCVLEEPRILVAKCELPPLALKIFPRANQLKRLAASAQKNSVDITMTMKEASKVNFQRVQIEASLGREVGSALIIDPAEFLAAADEAAAKYSEGFVHLVSVTSGVMTVPLPSYTTDDVNLRTNKQQIRCVEATFRYFTNPGVVPMGVALRLPCLLK